MKNKENALKKIEQIEGSIKNVKTSSYRGNAQEMNDYFKHLEELVPILYKEDYFNSSNDIVKYMFNKKLIHKYHSINNAHTICNLYIIITINLI